MGSYEDVRLAEAARKLHLPPEEGPVEFGVVHKLYDLTFDDANVWFCAGVVVGDGGGGGGGDGAAAVGAAAVDVVAVGGGGGGGVLRKCLV